MTPDKITVSLPTEGSMPAKTRGGDERFPVVFILPKSLRVGPKNVGGMKLRADLPSERLYDRAAAFCNVAIARDDVELFVVTDRRRKVAVRVRGIELAQALSDWKKEDDGMPSSSRARPTAFDEWKTLEGRCAMAMRRSEDLDAKRKAERSKR